MHFSDEKTLGPDENRVEKTEEVKEEVAGTNAEEKEEKPADAVEEKPAEAEEKEEKPADAVEEKPAGEEEKEETKKGFQPRATKTQTPTECALCGKSFAKKMWYYRNGAYFCNKKCYAKQAEKIKAEAEKAKAESEKSE